MERIAHADQPGGRALIGDQARDAAAEVRRLDGDEHAALRTQLQHQRAPMKRSSTLSASIPLQGSMGHARLPELHGNFNRIQR
jgi:hypothetical protein